MATLSPALAAVLAKAPAGVRQAVIYLEFGMPSSNCRTRELIRDGLIEGLEYRDAQSAGYDRPTFLGRSMNSWEGQRLALLAF